MWVPCPEGQRAGKKQSSQTNLAPSKTIYRAVTFMGRLSIISLVAYELNWVMKLLLKIKNEMHTSNESLRLIIDIMKNHQLNINEKNLYDIGEWI